MLKETELRENTPNAAKLIAALRSTGYDNYSAIADLVDNSIDAEASKIWIEINPIKEDFKIIIGDNGHGMDVIDLDQAMRLGSLTDRDVEADLGKFGMGLVTASISIGRKLTVITKNSLECSTSIQDLDEITKNNRFEKKLRSSTHEEILEFERVTHKASTGTVVIIEKCDHIQNKNINQLDNILEEQVARIFRLFIKSGKEIYLRGKKIEFVDPLMLDVKGTEVFSDDTFDIEVKGQKEMVRVKIVMLPDYDQQTSKIKGLSIANQGFYLMRNNREIAAGVTLGIFTKHNVFNRLRMEVYFTGNLDSLMGINFTKRELKPKQNILDKINQIAFPQIRTIRGQVHRSQAVSDDSGIDHDVAAKVIFEKSKLLVKPKVKVEKRSSASNHTGAVTAKYTGKERTPKTAREIFAEKVNCQFIPRELRGGNLFETEQVGKKTLIYYNIDHPFYQAFISENKDNQDLINAFDFLIYSLASAKLVVSNEENVELLETYQTIFSSNLRALIS